MVALARRSRRRPIDIWPGFVDALAALLIIFIFILMVFMVTQLYLREVLTGRDEALDRLNQQINELAEMLALERTVSTDLRLTVTQLSTELQSSVAAREELGVELTEVLSERELLAASLAAMTARAEAEADATAALREEAIGLRQQLAALGERAREGEQAFTAEREISAEALARVDLLNRQIAALRLQLARIAEVLEASEAKAKEQQVQIADLGRRLNVALASKVQELARYRSEFFGRLRDVLGDRPDILVVGDRFVFQSEVLFATGSAELGDEGQQQLARLAATLNQIATEIPADINWVLRVDGHTDRRPINTPQYASNWELSTARAISVVRFLIAQGVPPGRLAATGFGEFQPLDARDDEIAFRRNRRIELKLTQR
jgi:chemotaxis protein MotB